MCEKAEGKPISANNGSGDSGSEIDKTNLIINYIPQSTTVQELNALFQLAGELESVKIMRHPRTGYSYGYGFVKYHNEESAMKAIELFNKLPYRNKKLKVSFSRPPSQVTKNANLYISNLPKDFTDAKLGQIFGSFGEIIQMRLLRDKATSIPKGVAFVRYAKGEDARKAIQELNGRKLINAQYPLRVRIADDYSHQRANLFYDITTVCDPRGMPPFYMNRNFAQMSLRSPPPFPPYQPRYHGGGGDMMSTLPW